MSGTAGPKSRSHAGFGAAGLGEHKILPDRWSRRVGLCHSRPADRLYGQRSTHTLVINSNSSKTIADIPGQKIARGVAIVPEVGRGFISDGGGDGAIVIFDLKTYPVPGTIVAQPDADGIIFDPASGRILVVSGDKRVLMSLKPVADLVVLCLSQATTSTAGATTADWITNRSSRAA